jgi:LPS export ABC transporter protein LptC
LTNGKLTEIVSRMILSSFSHRYIRFVLLTVAGISLFLFSACENDPLMVKNLTRKKNAPAISTQHAQLYYSDSAMVKIKLNSPQVDYYQGDEPYQEFPKGLDVSFMEDGKTVTTRLTANYGIWKQNEKIMEAKNNVVVINEKGEKLNTEHLIWNEGADKITSDAFVKITTEDAILMGEGLESNQSFTKYRIKKPKGTIPLKE